MKLEEIDEQLQEVREELALTPALGKPSVNQHPVAALEGRELESLSEGEKIQCARDYFLSGNLSQIARERGVRYVDLLELARTALWQEEVKNLEREANAVLKVRLTGLLGRTLDQLEDRLENGDQKWYDKGLRKVPVSARDLATISAAIFDKKKSIEENENGFGSQEAKRLFSIADALRARSFGTSPEIHDAEVIKPDDQEG